MNLLHNGVTKITTNTMFFTMPIGLNKKWNDKEWSSFQCRSKFDGVSETPNTINNNHDFSCQSSVLMILDAPFYAWWANEPEPFLWSHQCATLSIVEKKIEKSSKSWDPKILKQKLTPNEPSSILIYIEREAPHFALNAYYPPLHKKCEKNSLFI